MHVAAAESMVHVMSFLLDNGADKEARNKNASTAAKAAIGIKSHFRPPLNPLVSSPNRRRASIEMGVSRDRIILRRQRYSDSVASV